MELERICSVQGENMEVLKDIFVFAVVIIAYLIIVTRVLPKLGVRT
jgi:hypothetical protein